MTTREQKKKFSAMEKAVPFIILKENQFILTKEAKVILEAIKGPVAIVSVAGVYRYFFLFYTTLQFQFQLTFEELGNLIF